MALQVNWVEKTERGSGLFAIESISLLYNAITTILILILYTQLDHPTLMLYERLGIASLTIALIILYLAVPCKLTAFLRIATQLGLLVSGYIRIQSSISEYGSFVRPSGAITVWLPTGS